MGLKQNAIWGVPGKRPTAEEDGMGRKFIDCREYPSETNCTVAFSAGSDEELLEVAVQHAVQVHRHKDSPELRQQIRNLFKEGTPPIETPRHST
jgi:predicted small metal-binding protein